MSTSTTSNEDQHKSSISQAGRSTTTASRATSVSSRDAILQTNLMTADFVQPKTEYYRMTNPRERPRIDSQVGYRRQVDDAINRGSVAGGNPVKFGWIVGVLIRSTLNIWGVMLFIRLVATTNIPIFYSFCILQTI